MASSVLDKILAHKKEEVAILKGERSKWQGAFAVPSRRNFANALHNENSVSIIAEVKKASPSKGVLRSDFNPVKIAAVYRDAGADALSVLTDKLFFMGSVEYLMLIRESVDLPVLRKDFIIDIVQIEQTASIGADAMLLIAAALDDVQIKDFYQASKELAIEPLVEVHNRRELDRVMNVAPTYIGINNRDLSTFKTDINVTRALMPHIPDYVTVVSESGIENRRQVALLKEAGVKAVLVGESLMRQSDPSALLTELKCRPGHRSDT